MNNLTGWTTTVALQIVTSLPFQAFEDALGLAETYLSNIGGWIPVDESDPTGEGAPANGISETNAAIAIVAGEYNRVYSSDVVATITVKANVQSYFAPGLSQAAILAALQETLQGLLARQANNAPFEILTVASVTGTVIENGIQTAAQMVQVNQLVTGTEKLSDPRALALKSARSRYSLDTTWNVSKVYTETGEALSCIIEKFQSTAYLVRDTSATKYYQIVLDPVMYTVISGIASSY